MSELASSKQVLMCLNELPCSRRWSLGCLQLVSGALIQLGSRRYWVHQHEAFSDCWHCVVTTAWLAVTLFFLCKVKLRHPIFLSALLCLGAETVTWVCYALLKARVMNSSENWWCLFLRLICQCISRGYSAHARSRKKLPAAGRNLLFVTGVSLIVDGVPGYYVKFSMTRSWKVCRWHGSRCMPFPQIGGNRKYGMSAKQHAATALCLFCSWYKNNIIPNGCWCQLTRPLLCEK